jgi:hypothetical protein
MALANQRHDIAGLRLLEQTNAESGRACCRRAVTETVEDSDHRASLGGVHAALVARFVVARRNRPGRRPLDAGTF